MGRLEGQVTLQLADPEQRPIWRPQYNLKADQVQGIRETVKGLLEAGILKEIGSSEWKEYPNFTST